MRILKGNLNFRENSGRKTKREQVRELLENYPNMSNRELAKISGMSRNTINKLKIGGLGSILKFSLKIIARFS